MNTDSQDKAFSAWDGRACPVASDLLKMLDEFAAQNHGLSVRNAMLRKELTATRGRSLLRSSPPRHAAR